MSIPIDLNIIFYIQKLANTPISYTILPPTLPSIPSIIFLLLGLSIIFLLIVDKI